MNIEKHHNVVLFYYLFLYLITVAMNINLLSKSTNTCKFGFCNSLCNNIKNEINVASRGEYLFKLNFEIKEGKRENNNVRMAQA